MLLFKNDYLWRMTMQAHHYQNNYRNELRKKIENLSGQVFSRNDLEKNRSNQIQLQLNRALKMLLDEGEILKISHGLYAKAEPITLRNGQTKILLKESFETVAMEALNKLGVQWELGRSIQLDFGQNPIC